VEGKGIPRHGYAIRADGAEVGHVTSGTLSPTLGVPVGMGYVAKPHDAPGSPILIDAKGIREFPARVQAALLEKH